MYRLIHLTNPAIPARTFPDLPSLLQAVQDMGCIAHGSSISRNVYYSDYPQRAPVENRTLETAPIDIKLLLDRR
jgi:hypothetical protein